MKLETVNSDGIYFRSCPGYGIVTKTVHKTLLGSGEGLRRVRAGSRELEDLWATEIWGKFRCNRLHLIACMACSCKMIICSLHKLTNPPLLPTEGVVVNGKQWSTLLTLTIIHTPRVNTQEEYILNFKYSNKYYLMDDY